MAKRIRKSSQKIGLRRAREIEAQVAEIIGGWRVSTGRLMELPALLEEFHRGRGWKLLGYRQFGTWAAVKFNKSYALIYRYLRIGQHLKGVPNSARIALGEGRCYQLARLAGRGAEITPRLLGTFSRFRVHECQGYVDRRLGLKSGFHVMFSRFSAAPHEASVIARGRRMARRQGYKTLGEAEASAWRAFIAANGTTAEFKAVNSRVLQAVN